MKAFSILTVAVSLLCSFHNAFASNEKSDLITAVQSDLAAITSEEKQLLKKKIMELQHSTGGLVHKVGLYENVFGKNRLVTCVTGRIGTIASFTRMSCVTSKLEYFQINIDGLDVSLVVALNLSVGWMSSAPKTGSYKVTFHGGAYQGVGGSYLQNDEIILVSVGAGMGAHLRYGVTQDSIFGGQLNIEAAQEQKEN